MPESAPIYRPGQAVTSKASAAILGGQLLVISGTGTVAPSAGASAAWFGVAAFDAAVNDNVTVNRGGVQLLTASGAVTAGDMVVSAAAGAVASSASPAIGTVVGRAMTTAASGAKVRVAFV